MSAQSNNPYGAFIASDKKDDNVGGRMSTSYLGTPEPMQPWGYQPPQAPPPAASNTFNNQNQNRYSTISSGAPNLQSMPPPTPAKDYNTPASNRISYQAPSGPTWQGPPQFSTQGSAWQGPPPSGPPPTWSGPPQLGPPQSSWQGSHATWPGPSGPGGQPPYHQGNPTDFNPYGNQPYPYYGPGDSKQYHQGPQYNQPYQPTIIINPGQPVPQQQQTVNVVVADPKPEDDFLTVCCGVFAVLIGYAIAITVWLTVGMFCCFWPV